MHSLLISYKRTFKQKCFFDVSFSFLLSANTSDTVVWKEEENWPRWKLPDWLFECVCECNISVSIPEQQCYILTLFSFRWRWNNFSEMASIALSSKLCNKIIEWFIIYQWPISGIWANFQIKLSIMRIKCQQKQQKSIFQNCIFCSRKLHKFRKQFE